MWPWGSSPLARGLRLGGPVGPAAAGIIPARAGFTFLATAPEDCAWDHPRSRGVYSFLSLSCWMNPGSSPLARGLRQVEVHRVRGQGIIPARAGFTVRGTGSCATGRDHPRSRGVYLRRMKRARWLGGSSPLARGLRSCARSASVRARIIPARAGFTLKAADGSHGRRDHPRSRGVY